MRFSTAAYILSFLLVSCSFWTMFRLLCCCLETQEGHKHLDGELQVALAVVVAAAVAVGALVAFEPAFGEKGRPDLGAEAEEEAAEEEEAEEEEVEEEEVEEAAVAMVATVATQTESQPPEDGGGQGEEALLRIQRLLEEFWQAAGPLVRQSAQWRSLAAGALAGSPPEGAPSC